MSRSFNTKIFLLTVLFFTAISSFAFKNNLTKSVNGQEPSDARIEEGSKLFKANCASCHALNGKVVGPALGNVVEKYDEDYEWLVAWIRNNQALIKAQDPRALAIYNEYNGSPMNIFENLSEDQVTSILMWIENGGDGTTAEAATSEETAAPVVSDSVFNRINWVLVVLGIIVFALIVLLFSILDMVSKITGRAMINWNNLNAFLFLAFGALFILYAIYEYRVHGAMLLPESASVLGVELDKIMKITIILTSFVFFVTQALLFIFAFIYREKPGKKAFYFPHNNKLEILWTAIPAVALVILVSGGLKVWLKYTGATPEENAVEVEVMGYQFGWVARYPGEDGVLGNADYNLISGTNPLGIANHEVAEELINELEEDILLMEKSISEIPARQAELKMTLGGRVGSDRKDHLRNIEKLNPGGETERELKLNIRARQTQIARIKSSLQRNSETNFYNGQGDDDIVVQEIHLVKDRPAMIKLRGRDVIHSAYLPYFRAQMNVVPGLPTHIYMEPRISTNEMRAKLNDPEFDYYIVCNKICGNAHFNMRMKVVVEDENSYNKWLSEQNATFVKSDEEPNMDEVENEETENEETEENTEVIALN
jgi:cytochrome c oxidase subunit 2